MALPSFRVSAVRRRERYPTLQAAWGFDEGTGTIAEESVGNRTYFQTGPSLGLTVDAGMTWVTGQAQGSALQNTGSGGSAHVQMNVAGTAMTLMGWARPTDLTSGSNRPLFGIWDAANINGSTFVAIWAQRGDFGTANVFQGNVRAGGSLQAINSGIALTLNTWTHLALSYDGVTMRLYKDGSQVASAAQPGAAYTGAATFNVLPDPVQAQVDDVRIFNAALSEAEIQSFMQQPVALP